MCFLGEGNWSKVAEVWIFGDLSLAKKNEPTYASLVPKERKSEIIADFSRAETPDEMGWLNGYKYWTLHQILGQLASFALVNWITLKNHRDRKVNNFPRFMIKNFMKITKLPNEEAFANSNGAKAWLRTLPGVVNFEVVKDEERQLYRCEVTLTRKIIQDTHEEEQEATFLGPGSRGESLAIILAGGLVLLEIFNQRLDEKSGGWGKAGAVQGMTWK